MKQLDINSEQKTSYCISPELRDEQIRINLYKVKDRIQPEDLKNEPIALVSFAPSLNDTWQELKKFKNIMTCSGAHKFLIEKGIIPAYHADLDPRSHKISMLGQPNHTTKYLIASTVHPNYLNALQGYDVRLWHIFADEEGSRVLPRGEWCITGGSSIGLRLMTLARFIGYTDFHIFGMDGSIRKGQTHTTEHPNAPKEDYETEYKGKKYLTTPSMLHVAKETFRELDMMADVKAAFYGEGLVQAMAKDYVPNPKRNTLIAFNKPELISEEYKKLNYDLHKSSPNYGMGGAKHKDTVIKLSKDLGTQSILDFGCGKSQLAKSLPFPIWEYDPAIPEKSEYPKPADIVICTDVLEHIEDGKLKFVLDELKRLTLKVGYFVISIRKAVKMYSNGKNTHNIVQPRQWWEKQLGKFFDIGTVIEKNDEIHIVVAPKKESKPEITNAERNGKVYSFLTPNGTTKWRANTLFTKEPSTVEWIENMKSGEVMYDIGANIGSYSVLAGVNGVNVYSFEPEADNYALLVKNLQLNGIEPKAYCIAISDEQKIGTLYAGGQGAGNACHTFNEKVGYDLQERESSFTQGSFGVTLDRLIEIGLPAPQHIKIDVDGLEYKVVNGAEHILSNGLKSLLVEVNPNLPQHRQMVEKLQSLGFTFNKEQVERATRKEGTFKGCAEYVFTKMNEVEKYLKEKIESAELITEPFLHFYIDEILPKHEYKKLVNKFPNQYTEIEKTRGTRGYPKRFTATLTDDWKQIEKNLTSGIFKEAICKKFGISTDCKEDVLLIRDKEGYKITPHTDTPHKVVSALFYFAKNKKNLQAGTNLYEREGFTCETGKHYDFKDFKKIKSFDYKPNSLLVFLRTNNSFHGVEPSDCVRDVLLYNLKK